MLVDYTVRIKETLVKLGADLVGVADVYALKGLKTNPHDLLAPFTRAVSMAI